MTEEDEAFNEIERRSKVKQTLVKAQLDKLKSLEPVAWYYPDGSPDQCTTNKAYAEMEPAWTPLYSHPQQRTWVGLSDAEMQDLWDRYDHMEMMRAIEAKLKQKNGSAEEKNT